MKAAIDRSDVASEFDLFEGDAVLYKSVVDPDSTDWPIERQEIRDALRGLRVMRLAQPMPFVLALMRCYQSRDLKKSALLKMLRLVENYHFQVTAISTKSSSGGISEMYASHARQFTEAASAIERRTQLNILARKLTERAPSRDDFVDAFVSRLMFADEYTRDKALVRYVLMRLHEHTYSGPALDYSKFSIEHLKPQSQIRKADDLSIVGSIGSLLFVVDSLNGELGSKSFRRKKRYLYVTRIAMILRMY